MAVTRAIELRTEIPGPRSREITERKERVVADPLGIYLPIMIAEGSGAIVNLSSVAGARGVPGRTPYAASKAAVEAVTRSAASSCARWGRASRAACAVRSDCAAPDASAAPAIPATTSRSR